MPWKECHVEDERLRFVARLMEGHAMSSLCAEFGISRKTGYKIYERYKHWGLRGLTDRSRRPYRHANQLPRALEDQIVALARISRLGRAEDSRAVATAGARRALSGNQHRPCGAGSAGAGETSAPPASPRRRDGAVMAEYAQRALVRGLQGRVYAGESSVLLSADDHRLCESVPADL